MATSDTVTGSATVHGELWGARARDWAEVQEPGPERALPRQRVGGPSEAMRDSLP